MKALVKEFGVDPDTADYVSTDRHEYLSRAIYHYIHMHMHKHACGYTHGYIRIYSSTPFERPPFGMVKGGLSKGVVSQSSCLGL